MYTEFGTDDCILCAEISKRFPSISVKRPGRVADSVFRIAAPATVPALNNSTVKLTGTPLRSYRQRVWKPQIRISTSEGSQ